MVVGSKSCLLHLDKTFFHVDEPTHCDRTYFADTPGREAKSRAISSNRLKKTPFTEHRSHRTAGRDSFLSERLSRAGEGPQKCCWYGLETYMPQCFLSSAEFGADNGLARLILLEGVVFCPQHAFLFASLE